ncbi:MAG: efflux RND transporter periplasmic adaptor subunit [Pseudomonadota bacterium]
MAGLAVLSLVGTVIYTTFVLEEPDVPLKVAKTVLPPVSYVLVKPRTAQAETRSFAQIRPLWSAELHASTGGRILEVTEKALAGRRVAIGDLLIRLEDNGLIADLREAELALAEAELALVQARNQTELRRRQAVRASVSEPTDLSLLLPEMRIAERAVTSAEARAAAAQAALRLAEIRAPFDGYVTARSVSPGQSVSPGDTLVSLVDGTRFELETGLSTRQWRLLNHPLGGTDAEVWSLQGTRLGSAQVRNAGGFRDEDTREFKVFLEVARDADAPQDVQLLSNDLVELVFKGRQFDETLTLPETSLTRDGAVWYLDADDRLRRLEPDVLWQGDGDVVILAPDPDQSYRIAVTPLVSFLVGAQVSPTLAD